MCVCVYTAVWFAQNDRSVLITLWAFCFLGETILIRKFSPKWQLETAMDSRIFTSFFLSFSVCSLVCFLSGVTVIKYIHTERPKWPPSWPSASPGPQPRQRKIKCFWREGQTMLETELRWWPPGSPSCPLASVKRPEWHYLCPPLWTVCSNPGDRHRSQHLQPYAVTRHCYLLSMPPPWFHSTAQGLLHRPVHKCLHSSMFIKSDCLGPAR